jgi:hypothetical protein
MPADPLIWNTCRREGQLRGVLLMRASHVIFARQGAAMDGLDRGADFGEAHELDGAIAATVAPPLLL